MGPADPPERFHGAAWEALAARRAEITGWVKEGKSLVKTGHLLARPGTVVLYRTIQRFRNGGVQVRQARSTIRCSMVTLVCGMPGRFRKNGFHHRSRRPGGDGRCMH
jgi:hypothetical protein